MGKCRRPDCYQPGRHGSGWQCVIRLPVAKRVRHHRLQRCHLDVYDELRRSASTNIANRGGQGRLSRPGSADLGEEHGRHHADRLPVPLRRGQLRAGATNGLGHQLDRRSE